MRVFLTGGTGLIGRRLVGDLVDAGAECVVLSRSGRNPWNSNRVRVVDGDATVPGAWQAEVAQVEVVVNLAGETLVHPLHRWTEDRKRRIRTSRIETTRNVARAIAQAASPPRVFVSASAVGYYGDGGDRVLDESALPGDDFLGRLCVEWEEAARAAEDVTRVVLVRTGMVLAKRGGVLDQLLPLFEFFLGGPWGSGRQWWPWIHLADEIGLIRFAMERDISGPLNLTAPNPVTVEDFATGLADALRRPSWAKAPAFVLRLTLGCPTRFAPGGPAAGTRIGVCVRIPEVEGSACGSPERITLDIGRSNQAGGPANSGLRWRPRPLSRVAALPPPYAQGSLGDGDHLPGIRRRANALWNALAGCLLHDRFLDGTHHLSTGAIPGLGSSRTDRAW